MINVLGTIYAPSTQDGAALVALPGYHVNSPFEVADWEPFKVTPNTPYRVFSGHPTFFYCFADEDEFNQHPLAS